ncbi:thiol:disulfide interchange protein DsbA/DsbL [Gynuella sunshinyii]|uniref:Thiol:disulfide interchange protein n=1 Tax=Gynuella sunshinyii YC6258 TaxID=1445510 RepID=A0A0C5VHI8_9GAMM|nr:thiol:disulfide interchange protein DsbA/DsbL [Gynuella sunshinyii]AJQ92788.1 protein-disulfide isomerase [Gynuella sunshinyii YC6258]
MRFLKLFVMAAAILLTGHALAADKYIEGKHYKLLPTPLPVALEPGKKVVVWEFFSYTCPHCYNLEPALQQWIPTLADDVQYEPVATPFSHWIPMVKSYYAAELLGVADTTHEDVFNAIFVNKAPARTVEDYANIYAKLGVDKDKFLKTAESFGVNTKLKQAEMLTKGAGIMGTPSMVVAGKYLVTGETAGSNVGMIDVVNFLIEKERSES